MSKAPLDELRKFVKSLKSAHSTVRVRFYIIDKQDKLVRNVFFYHEGKTEFLCDAHFRIVLLFFINSF